MITADDFSQKGRDLIALYTEMVEHEYTREIAGIQNHVPNVYSDFELRRFRHAVRETYVNNGIGTVLDYGCGGSDWDSKDFSDGCSAKEFFSVETVCRYEPARQIDERCVCDLVSCFDVLEHIHILDAPMVIRELFSLARKVLIVNIACYPAAARLPNSENAHITVRTPDFWYGVFSTIAVEFPDVEVHLFCSRCYKEVTKFQAFSGIQWSQTTTCSTK